MSFRFLIDECLSVSLVATAKACGHGADHVVHLGKSGWQDWNLVRFAVMNDYVIVTNNRRDFLKEYAKLELHPGLIVVIARGSRSDQVGAFDSILDCLQRGDIDIVNNLVEILPDHRVVRTPWSANLHDLQHLHNPIWG